MASKKNITADVDDLRKVYLHAFDATVTDPATVEEEVDGINTKYARELLKVLTDGNLLVLDPIEEGTDAWQPNLNMDTNDRKDAEAAFDEWANENGLQVKTAKAKAPKRNDVGVHDCYCGCGEQVPGKSFYRPGHDARHAGVIGRLVASTGDTKHYGDLPSERLVEKAKGIAAKAIEKADAKRTREHAKAEVKAEANKGKKAKPEWEAGTVRIGKREGVEARRLNGKVEYKDAKGMVVPASKSATASFKVA
jgi:hypothetical protein